VGDEREEFAQFYQTSQDGCLRAVYASVGDRLLAEDLVA
jgi:RNA polymerase sigma-70 factor (ECF subfamily)